MILWIKYRGHPFDTALAMKASKVSGSNLQSWIQPGDYELLEMGKNSRWLITSDDQDKNDASDYVVPKTREEVKIWLDINCMKIRRRIGFSECVHSFGPEMGPFWKHLWAGYDLVENGDFGNKGKN